MICSACGNLFCGFRSGSVLLLFPSLFSVVSDACLYVIVIATIYVRVVSSPSEAMAGGRGAETSGERRTRRMWRDTPAWTSIRGGSNTWREWIDIIGCLDDQTPIGVDKHGVTDRMRGGTAARTGSELAQMDSICPILISKSGARWQTDERGDIHPPWHRLETLNPSSAGYDCVSQLRGIIFTDIPRRRVPWVEVYRDETYMPPNTIGVLGDKGQVASLFRRPCLLFDDHEYNVDLVRRKGVESDGVVVYKQAWEGRRFWQQNGYMCCSEPRLWRHLIRTFVDGAIYRGWRLKPVPETDWWYDYMYAFGNIQSGCM